jgi:hypothetical protein
MSDVRELLETVAVVVLPGSSVSGLSSAATNTKCLIDGVTDINFAVYVITGFISKLSNMKICS